MFNKCQIWTRKSGKKYVFPEELNPMFAGHMKLQRHLAEIPKGFRVAEKTGKNSKKLRNKKDIRYIFLKGMLQF